MKRHELTDEQWALIEPLVPESTALTGRPARDLTAGETDFTNDSILHDVLLGLKPNKNGEYVATHIRVRCDSGEANTTHIDDVYVQSPAGRNLRR